MMGNQQPQKDIFSYNIDLDKRVRPDNPLRQIKQRVDFSFVRAEVASLYGYNGNESVDPEIILKMMFLLFYYDVPSERELMGQIAERMDFLWFLGYELSEKIPDHSVLSKARKRWGRVVFESVFVRTVKACVEAGLVDGGKIHLDSSLVDANASKDSILKGPPQLIAALKQVYGAQEHKLDEPQPTAGDATDSTVNARLVSTTDPDAPVVSQRGGHQGEPRPRYKHHRAVDDAHGVITAVQTTGGDVNEGQQLIGLIEQHQDNTQRSAQCAVADSKYGTVENFRTCQQRGIRTHMADLQTAQGRSGRRAGIYDESAFVYDAASDSYRCPAGQTLQRHHWNAQRRIWEYRTAPGLCAACSLRRQCTRAKSGRSLRRHEAHELVQRGRAQANSAAGRRDRQRRKVKMEGSFADAANNHGFKRARWRRLWRQEIQDWMIAAVQNIRILLRHSGKPAATMAATAVAVHASFILLCLRLEQAVIAIEERLTAYYKRNTVFLSN